jgi:hypothetical protein
MDCQHEIFQIQGTVHRLTNDIGQVNQYMADVRCFCEQCGTPFQFLGIPMGVSTHQATVSVDCTEIRLPIVPMPPSKRAQA